MSIIWDGSPRPSQRRSPSKTLTSTTYPCSFLLLSFFLSSFSSSSSFPLTPYQHTPPYLSTPSFSLHLSFIDQKSRRMISLTSPLPPLLRLPFLLPLPSLPISWSTSSLSFLLFLLFSSSHSLFRDELFPEIHLHEVESKKRKREEEEEEVGEEFVPGVHDELDALLSRPRKKLKYSSD